MLNVFVWVKFINKLYQSHFTRNTLSLAIRAIWSDQSSHHGLYRRRANEAAKWGRPMGAKEQQGSKYTAKETERKMWSAQATTTNNNATTCNYNGLTIVTIPPPSQPHATRLCMECLIEAAAKLRRTKPRTNKMKREREKNGTTWKDRNSKINYTRMTW